MERKRGEGKRKESVKGARALSVSRNVQDDPATRRKSVLQKKERTEGRGITIRKCVPTLFELVIFHNVLGPCIVFARWKLKNSFASVRMENRKRDQSRNLGIRGNRFEEERIYIYFRGS